MRRRDLAALRESVLELGRSMDKAAVPVLRQLSKIVSKDAKADYRSTGIGRALWSQGTKPRGKPPLRVTVAKPRFSGSKGGYIAKVKATGMAAFIEQGFRTKRHFIWPKSGKKAVAYTKNGAVMVRAWTVHPGSKIKKNPALQEAVVRIVPQAQNEMRRVLLPIMKKAWQ